MGILCAIKALGFEKDSIPASFLVPWHFVYILWAGCKEAHARFISHVVFICRIGPRLQQGPSMLRVAAMKI